MDVVEHTLTSDIDEFLDRPLFCFLAQRTADGPRLSPLWFLWEEGAIWNVAQSNGRSYSDRVQRDPRTAIAVVDFDRQTGRVEHVGMRGKATLRPYDRCRAERLFRKYLSDNRSEWPERFRRLDTGDYRLIKFEPETVVARDQSYPAPPGLNDCEEE